MGRIIGLVLTVLAIYLAANHVTGGRSTGEDEVTRRTIPQRAGDSVRKSFDEGEERLQRLLPE